MAKILKVGWVYRGANGVEAAAITDGEGSSADGRWKSVEALENPVVNLGATLWLEDNEQIRLPFEAQPALLPDRTGVLVVFKEGRYSYTRPNGSDVFPKPNNAAIFNSDGSLRFQVKLPDGDYPAGRIGGFHSGTVPERFEGMLGVVVAATEESQPEWLYMVDPERHELLLTGLWVRW